MRLKFVREEDFVNYKKCSMFLGTCFCDFKCCKEAGFSAELCQNEPWSKQPIKEYKNEWLLDWFDKNPLTEAIVFGGMEPIAQFDEIIEFLEAKKSSLSFKVQEAEVIIYTGYYPNEIRDKLLVLRNYPNVIMKYGRYVPNNPGRYDAILEVHLASDNQYAERLNDVNWSDELWLSR